MEQRNSQGIITKLVILLVLLFTVFSIGPLILGSTKPIHLSPAPALGGVVSQAFTSGGSNTIPVFGRDYSLENVHNFENKQWVVATIQGTTTNVVTDGIIVLHQKNGVYTTALGPGSALAKPDVDSLPTAVGSYIDQLGVTYDPGN
jgi:hypothetical protein